MQVMTKEQSDMLDKLVRLARGDALLVEEAIRACAGFDSDANLEDVVQYIVKKNE